MPSTDRDDRSPDYIRIDAIVDLIDDDPFRFLDGPLSPYPRIRGLRTLRRVRGWRVAEKKLAEIQNRKPRKKVMDALDSRERVLEESGEFDCEPTPTTITLGITPDIVADAFSQRDPGSASRVTPVDGPTFDPEDFPDWLTVEWDPESVRHRYVDVVDQDADTEQELATDGGQEVADGE